MRKEHRSFLTTQRLLLAGLTLAAVAVVGLPVSASANSTAGTTIMNKVTVSYTDAGGLNPFSADATTIVTVNLVKAALTISNAPSGNAVPPALSCTSIATAYPSGSTINFLYALSANANGQDTYNLSMANTPNNVNNVTVAYSTLDYQGLNPVAAPATRALGSAIPTAITGAGTLEFPGGALAGFAVNDLVAVQTAAGARVYRVTAFNPGTAPVYSHVGNVAYTNLGSMTTPEAKGSLTLGAWAVQSITLNGATVNFGGTPAPAFTTPATAAILNVPVSEMVLVKVDVTASTPSVDGTVDFTLTTTDSAAVPGPGDTATAPCTAGTFKAPTLTIKKEASNFTAAPGVFGATATGNPGQILEYRVTVTNTGGQASLVNISDNVPAYTTLVTHTTYGNGTPGTIFAKVTDNAANTLSLTSAVDSEVQPLAPVETGFGDAAGTAATSALKFWLGDTATGIAPNGGGKLPYCSDGSAISALGVCSTGTAINTLTILYQVKID